jgi:hypothetical protein
MGCFFVPDYKDILKDYNQKLFKEESIKAINSYAKRYKLPHLIKWSDLQFIKSRRAK